MNSLERVEWLREQADDAKWNGDWDRGEALEARAEAIEDSDWD